MIVGSSVVAGSLLLGTIVGSLAGYYGGRLDRFVNVIVMNAFLSFPGILLAIAFVAFLGPGLWNLILALIIGGWVGYARLVRAQVLAAREREYVEAARALGASDLRILARHILPNIMQPVIVQAAIGMAGAILAEGTMSFLGLGVPPPAAKLGSHAQRWPLAPVRLPARRPLSRRRRHARRARLQLHRRRHARLPRSPLPHRSRSVSADSSVVRSKRPPVGFLTLSKIRLKCRITSSPTKERGRYEETDSLRTTH